MRAGHNNLKLIRILAALEAVAIWISAVSLALVALLTAAAVSLRAAGFNLPDALELSGLFMAVAIFWGMVGSVLRDDFIKVDFIVMVLGPRAVNVLRIFASVITAAFFVVLARAGVAQLFLTLHSGEVTPELRLPLWPLLALGLSGLFLTALVSVLRLWPHRASQISEKEISHGK